MSKDSNINFNSIKVRLELVKDYPINGNVDYFNSIKVRLELFQGCR